MTNSKELEPIEIHFGDTFEVAEGYFPQTTRIIIGLDDNHRIHGLTLRRIGAAKATLRPPPVIAGRPRMPGQPE